MPFPWYTLDDDGHVHFSKEDEEEIRRLANRSHDEFVADLVATGESPMVAELIWASRQPENRG